MYHRRLSFGGQLGGERRWRHIVYVTTLHEIVSLVVVGIVVYHYHCLPHIIINVTSIHHDYVCVSISNVGLVINVATLIYAFAVGAINEESRPHQLEQTLTAMASFMPVAVVVRLMFITAAFIIILPSYHHRSNCQVTHGWLHYVVLVGVGCLRRLLLLAAIRRFGHHAAFTERNRDTPG